MKPLHRHAVLSFAVFGALLAMPTYAADPAGPGLKDVYKDRFLIGTAADLLPDGFSQLELNNIKHTFNVVTPENYMKPGAIHPAEDIWSFARPDAMVNWCLANNIKVHGHTLSWHSQTGNWFFEGGDKAVVTKRLQDHVKTLVGHYKGKIYSWDVVNEAIADGGSPDTENLRRSQWTQNIGPEFLTIAFKAAHEADPDCKLYYNDYNIENGNKHQNSLHLLKRLIADGAPVYGVGIQGHWSTNGTPFDALDKAIANYAALGLKVSITELDITINGQTGGQLGGRGGRGGAAAPANPAVAMMTTVQNAVLDLSDDQKAKLTAASGVEATTDDALNEIEVKMLAALTPAQAAKWETARLKSQVNSAFTAVAFSDAQAELAAPIITDSANRLANAKDKATLVKAKAEFWSKASALLTNTQLAQLMAPTFPAGRGRGGMGMGMGMGGARGGAGGATAAPAPQPVGPMDSIVAAITDLTDAQKAKLTAANDALNAKIRDWQTASQRVMVQLQPQYSAGQVSYDYEIKQQAVEQFKQNSIREDLINDAELVMVAALTPDQAKKWETSRLNSQATAAFAMFGGAIKYDNILADAAGKLASAKTKDDLSVARTEFWKKALLLLDETQTVQFFTAKAPNVNIPNPKAGIATEQALQQQAQVYARLFQIFEKHKNSIDRVTFWGLNDARSWRAGQAALLFDVNNNRKPAYDAIVNVLNPK